MKIHMSYLINLDFHIWILIRKIDPVYLSRNIALLLYLIVEFKEIFMPNKSVFFSYCVKKYLSHRFCIVSSFYMSLINIAFSDLVPNIKQTKFSDARNLYELSILWKLEIISKDLEKFHAECCNIPFLLESEFLWKEITRSITACEREILIRTFKYRIKSFVCAIKTKRSLKI